MLFVKLICIEFLINPNKISINWITKNNKVIHYSKLRRIFEGAVNRIYYTYITEEYCHVLIASKYMHSRNWFTVTKHPWSQGVQ